jgi:ParB/RepB/Spo0J family partition protein
MSGQQKNKNDFEITRIKIGKRMREDLGDIEDLAESINLRGLLHLITIDENFNLIAGHRRLEACKLLGWEYIEARTISDLTEKEKRLIELEENTKRKDLTEYEKSKNLDELVNLTKEVLKEELPSPGDGKPGRPSKSNSREKVAERLGISTGAIFRSQTTR